MSCVRMRWRWERGIGEEEEEAKGSGRAANEVIARAVEEQRLHDHNGPGRGGKSEFTSTPLVAIPGWYPEKGLQRDFSITGFPLSPGNKVFYDSSMPWRSRYTGGDPDMIVGQFQWYLDMNRRIIPA